MSLKVTPFCRIVTPLCFGLFAYSAAPVSAQALNQSNLVSDIAGLARHTDSDLVNPWGISESATSPFWISDNGTSKSTLYNASGVKQGLIVDIPPVGASAPTGQVFYGGASGFLTNGAPSRFIFVTEGGTIAAWNGSAGTTAVQHVDNSATAVYKGLAIGTTGGNTFLYAANFTGGTVDVIDSNFAAATLAGNFTDPTLPSGFAPFNVQNLGGSLFVTYAEQSGGTDEVDGPGLGFVDQFNTDGTFVRRIAGGGNLNAPWGLAIAPASFVGHAGDLLVGNFGSGNIETFDLTTLADKGMLMDASNSPFTIDGLWALQVGNGTANGGRTDAVYFTAGIDGESHGLFGLIAAAPEAGSLQFLIAGGMLLGSGLIARRRAVSRA